MPNMFGRARFACSAVVVFAGLSSVAAPTALQMAYARSYVGMKGCQLSSMDEVRSNPIVANTPVVWPNGSPDGGTLLHAAAQNGCYDIGQLLVVDYGLDPAQEADAGAGMGGKTPYDLCEKAREESEADGQPELCDPDYWLEIMEEATEFKQNGGQTAKPLIEKRAGQRKPQGERKRQRSEQPGVTDNPDKPSASEATKSDKKLSPAEKRAAMEARIAEKKRKKAEQEKNAEL